MLDGSRQEGQLSHRPTLLLASASPRRAALLEAAGIPFERGPSPQVDESPPVRADGGPLEPGEVVRALAVRKAEAAHRLAPTRLLLSADTLVFLDGLPLGKPAHESQARQMLRALSGREHEVWTGLALLAPSAPAALRCQATAACTRVRFRELSEREIGAYVAGGEPLDKAGAYGIQGGAAGFVQALEGDRDTVIGLPLRALHRLLARLGGPWADLAD